MATAKKPVRNVNADAARDWEQAKRVEKAAVKKIHLRIQRSLPAGSRFDRFGLKCGTKASAIMDVIVHEFSDSEFKMREVKNAIPLHDTCSDTRHELVLAGLLAKTPRGFLYKGDGRTKETSRTNVVRSSTPADVQSLKTSGGMFTSFADESAIEGLKSEVVSLKSTRSRKLRDLAFMAANGVCEVCGRDFSKVLGGHGLRVLQVHHRDQLSTREAPSVTKVSDLAVVCANCHLLLHLDVEKALTIQELREMLRADGFLNDLSRA